VTDAPDYRTDEDVDIETCTDDGGGYNIGWSTSGEWLEYTVDVASAGLYTIDIRAASEDADKSITLEIDGNALVSDLNIPATGKWTTWESVIVENVQLEAGIQVIRLTIGDVDYVNLNKMTFTMEGTPPAIAMTLPGDKTEFYAGQAVAVSSEASSSTSTIAKVELYVDNKLVETDNTDPYSFEWTAETIGTYVLKVIATDAEGATASASTTVSIVEKPATIVLKKGWNLVGYPYKGDASIETAFSSIISDLQTVKNLGGFWDKSVNSSLHSLTSIEWGQGYYIKVNSDCELVW